MTRMLIIGPPGSGKGTQAERISERLGVVAISTGDIFRANVKGETPLGVEAKKYMDAGDFVPDSVTNKMVRDRLNEDDVDGGFLLDGYPRTTAQVDYLDGILAEGDQKLDVVLQLTADDEELVKRLLGRAKETGRSDDNEGVIRHRLDLYHEQTEPVVAKYAERGILTRVDGIGGIDEVTDRVMEAIKQHRQPDRPACSPWQGASRTTVCGTRLSFWRRSCCRQAWHRAALPVRENG
ncbi:adenylate kinase [Arthrobacter sp. Hiyo6]|nr:adenylate kinase [Arthrobacter sp. Hiyo6]